MARRNGLCLIWKPSGPGSQDLLGQFKRELGLEGKGRTGIGHTGTLDPFAEGLLCVGIGEATKLLAPLTGLPKTYRASLVFNVSSHSLDITGELQWSGVELSKLQAGLGSDPNATLAGFLEKHIGPFQQTPPLVSAIRIDGKRGYEYARQGIEVEMKPRPAGIIGARHIGLREAQIEARPILVWDFEVSVSSGTYIRALARDWGLELTGHAGLLNGLVRTRIGSFEGAPDMGVKWLGVNDLKGLFEIETLAPEAVDPLRKNGRWTPGPMNTGASPAIPKLLMSPAGEVIAYTAEGGTKIGRVFLEDPLT